MSIARSTRIDQQCGFTYVYLVQATDGGPMKIGTTKTPERRLQQLQCGNPKTLVMRFAVMVDEGPWLEKFIHKNFGHLRIRGEWFESSDEIYSWFWLAQENRVQSLRLRAAQILKADTDSAAGGSK